MTRQNLVIGVGAVATAGKDTFYKLFNKKFPNSRRFALADNLKHELNPFFKSQYNIDIFNCSPEEKEAIRPILVAHGKIRRKASNGTYWTSKLKAEIEQYHRDNPKGIAVVTDIRYDEFEKDEAHWLQEEMKGVLVHIQRYHDVFLGGRVFVKPPNLDEELNDPKIREKSNYKIQWPSVDNIDDLNKYIDEFADWLNK